MVRAARNRSMPLVPPQAERRRLDGKRRPVRNGFGQGADTRISTIIGFSRRSFPEAGEQRRGTGTPFGSGIGPHSVFSSHVLSREGTRSAVLSRSGGGGAKQGRGTILHFLWETACIALCCSTSSTLPEHFGCWFWDSGGGRSGKMAALDGFSTLVVSWTPATEHDSFELVRRAPVPAPARRPILVRQFERNLASSNVLFSLSMW